MHIDPPVAPDSLPTNGYRIVSHGGIGNSEKNYNLSGSMHELQVSIRGKVTRIMIDMWAYQWNGELKRNNEELIQWIDSVIFTHGHMDHIGSSLEIITRENFPEVYSTPGTKQVMKIALTDAVKIALADYKTRLQAFQTYVDKTIKPAIKFVKNHENRGKKVKKVSRDSGGNRLSTTEEDTNKNTLYSYYKEILNDSEVDPNDKNWYEKLSHPPEPRFDEKDVSTLIKSIKTHTTDNGWQEISPGIKMRFYNAGHIIGSVSVVFEITYNNKKHNLLFSGDLGSYKWDMHLNGVPTPPNNLKMEFIMTESTYGGRVRAPFAEDMKLYEDTIERDVMKYDQIIHSCFSLDRLQNILFRVIDMKKRGIIPGDIPIYVDSKMWAEYIDPYLRQAARLDDKVVDPKQKIIRHSLGKDYEVREAENIRKFLEYLEPVNNEYIIVDKDTRPAMMELLGKKIILTASGMAEWGPIMEYLKQYGGDEKSAFYFPGFLVPGTRGYQIADEHQMGWQKKVIEIDDTTIEIRARMKQIRGFSGHADEEDILTWMSAIKMTKDSVISIIHGDIHGTSASLKNTLKRKWFNNKIIVPDIGEAHVKDFDTI